MGKRFRQKTESMNSFLRCMETLFQNSIEHLVKSRNTSADQLEIIIVDD